MGNGSDELILAATNKVYRYLLKHGANLEDAKDVTQDAAYKSLKYIDSIDPQNYSAWLLRVALNGYYDLCRRRKRISEANIEAIIDDSDTPEDALLKDEARGDLLRALDKLPEIQRQLLFLKYEQGLSYEEIADIQDIKADRVRTYLYRARQNLSQIIRGDKH